MASSRDAILRAVRRAQPEGTEPLPDLSGLGSPLGDRAAAFTRALEAAGGRCVRIGGADALEAVLAALPAYAQARTVYSACPGLLRASPGAEACERLRADGGVDCAVLPAAFGVAENGAVWVDAGALPERALLWLAEHLVLVVPAAELVDDLHAAYARLRLGAPGFGVFVAGPSKTADIEQALVIGAQGPRSTTVILVGQISASAAAPRASASGAASAARSEPQASGAPRAPGARLTALLTGARRLPAS